MTGLPCTSQNIVRPHLQPQRVTYSRHQPLTRYGAGFSLDRSLGAFYPETMPNPSTELPPHKNLTLLAIRRQPLSLFELWSKALRGCTPQRPGLHPDTHAKRGVRGFPPIKLKESQPVALVPPKERSSTRLPSTSPNILSAHPQRANVAPTLP